MAELRFDVTADTKKAASALGAFATDLQKKIGNAVKALPAIELDANSTDAQKEMAKLRAELQALADKRIGVDLSAEDALKEADRIQTALRQLEGSSTDVQVKADASAADRALGDVQSQLRQLNGTDAEVQVTADTSGAEEEISSFGDAAKIGAAAAGVAAGALLTSSLANALEFSEAQTKLEAQLGGAGDVWRQAGEVAGNLYTSAYGESIADVGANVATVLRSGLLEGEAATTESLTSITGKIMSVSEAFDQDFGGAVNGVSQMVKTGLAPNAEVALDILTRGFQVGNDKAEDLIDTMNEYGTQFRKLGVDGPQAMGLISQGLQAGARDADIVADAIKEFSIRAIDGSVTTVDGFTSIGLSAKDMSAKIAQGGPVAAAALDLTLDRLRAVKDPADRARIATELFGTQAEDLGDALFALDPSTATAKLGEFTGAAGKLDEAVGSTPQAKVEGMTRKFEAWTASLISTKGPIGDAAAAVAAFGPQALGVAGPLVAMVATLRMTGVVSSLAGVQAGVAGIGTAAGTASAAGGGIGLLTKLLKFAGIAGGLYLIGQAVDDVNVKAAGGVDKLKGQADALHDLLAAPFALVSNPGGTFDEIGAEWGSLVTQFQTGTSTMGQLWGDFQREMSGFQLAPVSFSLDSAPASSELDAFIADIDRSGASVNINGNTNMATDALRTIIGAIAAGAETVQINGNAMPAQDALTYVMGLINQGAGTVDVNGNPVPAGEVLAQVLRNTNNAWANVNVGANTGSANTAMNNLVTHWNGYTIDVTAVISSRVGGLAGGGLIGYAGGGLVGETLHAARGMIVPGYAPGRDTVPAQVHGGPRIMLSPGEAVLVPELVRQIGGRNILEANARASGGRPASILGAFPGAAGGMLLGEDPSVGAAGRIAAALGSPGATMRAATTGTIAVSDAATRAEVRALRAETAAQTGELRNLRGVLAGSTASAPAVAVAAAARVRSDLGAWGAL